MELSRDKIKEIINDDWLLMDDCEGNKNCDVVKEMARIALASLEAEPVAWLLSGGGAKNHVSFDSGNAYADPLREVTPLHIAPPAPVSVPDERAAFNAWNNDTDCPLAGRDAKTAAWLAWSRRAAMLQGAEPVSQRYTLSDGFDFDRFNDVVWLEAVASNPHMHSPTTSTIAMVALELNRKLAAGNSPAIPDGWVMVPVEPTQAMIDAHIGGVQSGGMQNGYRAMLAAAPQQEVK